MLLLVRSELRYLSPPTSDNIQSGGVRKKSSTLTCTAASAPGAILVSDADLPDRDLPTKVATLPINPTQNDSPCVGQCPSFSHV